MIAGILLVAAAAPLVACNAHDKERAMSAADRGAAIIASTGCGSCHSIPGIAGADGRVGPPLEHLAARIYIAGILRNTPDNLARWVRNPQKIVPGNVMPEMGLSDFRQPRLQPISIRSSRKRAFCAIQAREIDTECRQDLECENEPSRNPHD